MEGAQSPQVFRRSANYQPSLWDDSYIQSLPDGSLVEAEFDLWVKLKEEVRHLIDHNKQEDIIELLELVDNLRQLGVSYHFDCEIKKVLSFINSSLERLSDIFINNLHGSALLFRILRENGISTLSEDFLVKSFKNENGSVKFDIVNDLNGMLSLYEASFLNVDGEYELDEAMEFTTKQLSNFLKKPVLINPLLFDQISHALELPLHLRMQRLHTRWFIGIYERQQNMNTHLLAFAKLDFNLLQSIHKKELKEMSRWWRSLNIAGDEFNFARNRLMEIYFWSMGSAFEPHFWRCRKEITKLGCLITMIDDIYDVYASLDELVLFTNAIDEWKISEMQRLPNYMKIILTIVFNTVNDIACALSIEKGLDILPQLKRVWRDLCKGYLVEAIWYNTRYTPTLNEYMENAWVSISVPLVLSYGYCLSEDLTAKTLNILEFYPKVTQYSSIISRLYDDLSTSTDELQRGDVPKSIQCHMNETNVSESIARDHIRHLIKRYWKQLNGEYISNFNSEESFKRYVLNFPRTTQCLYQYGDGFGKPGHHTKDMIISSLINPVPL